MARTSTVIAAQFACGWLACTGFSLSTAVGADPAPVRGEILVRHIEQFEPAHGIAFRAMRKFDGGEDQDVLTIALGDVATPVDGVRASLRDEGTWRPPRGQARLLIESTSAGTPSWLMIEHGLGYIEVDLEQVDIKLTISAKTVRGHVRSKQRDAFPASANNRLDFEFELPIVDLR